MTLNPKHHSCLSPEFTLLGFLYKQPSYGYDLHKQLVTELGFVWHISQSQTYNILKRLENQGDISSTILEQSKLPARQVLHITTKGRERFDKWLDTPTCSSLRVIRLEFITRLFFVQRIAPEKTQHLLDSQSAEINATLTRLELSQANILADQIFNRLSLRLRIQQLHSALNWLDECRKALAYILHTGTYLAMYPIAALTSAPQPDLAAEFIAYVLSADGQSILKKWGFTLVNP
jgi:DNA-binding PadR family transcriptional regulator